MYHAINPQKIDVLEVLANNNPVFIKAVSLRSFIDNIFTQLEIPGDRRLLLRFLLYQGWLCADFKLRLPQNNVLYEKTQLVLKKCGFKWATTDTQMFYRFVKSMSEIPLTEQQIIS